jgi:dipeptidyl aminopeptidase/acylaminoacyl peptidase
MKERARFIAQIVLVAVSVAAAAGAAYRYQSTRAGPAPTPQGRAVVANPPSTPVGGRPFLQLFGFRSSQIVKVWFCAAGSRPPACADLGSRRGRGSLQSRPIPTTVPSSGGGQTTVLPGSYVLRAVPEGGAEGATGRFTVIAFKIGVAPHPRTLQAVDLRRLQLGPARQIAKGAPCDVHYTPDDRIVIASELFDPQTAVSVDLRASGAELAWSPNGQRLAIVTDDRHEIRMAKPDGSEAEAVVREARGFINSVSWATDSNKLAYVLRPQPGVTLQPVRAPTVVVLDLLDGSRAQKGPGEAVAWSPRGDRLAVEVAEGAGRAIQISDVNGARTRLVDGRAPAWSPDGSTIAFVRPVSGDTGAGWMTKADALSPVMVVQQDVCGLAFSADAARVAVVTKSGGATTLFLRSINIAPAAGSPRP